MIEVRKSEKSKIKESLVKEGKELTEKAVKDACMAIFGLVVNGLMEANEAENFLEDSINKWADEYRNMTEAEYAHEIIRDVLEM